MNRREPLHTIDEDALIEILELTGSAHLPDDVTRSILGATVESQEAPPPIYRLSQPARWLAAASILLAASIVGYLSLAPSGPSRAEAEEAARELRIVFASTSRAIRHANAEGVSQVMTQGVARATRHAPLLDSAEHARMEH